jgi:hypothetical protein
MQEKRITVWGRSRDEFKADIAACARSILDDELLSKPFRELLADQACKYIGVAAGREADDGAHGLRRIGLRPSEAR